MFVMQSGKKQEDVFINYTPPESLAVDENGFPVRGMDMYLMRVKGEYANRAKILVDLVNSAKQKLSKSEDAMEAELGFGWRFGLSLSQNRTLRNLASRVDDAEIALYNFISNEKFATTVISGRSSFEGLAPAILYDLPLMQIQSLEQVRGLALKSGLTVPGVVEGDDLAREVQRRMKVGFNPLARI
jgi:hypothetical protein